MSSVPRDIIEANLLRKGFRRLEQHSDHRFYYLYIDDRRSHIRTKISTGSGYKDYSIDLLKKMKLQLKFESISQLLDFLRCPLGYREYLEILRRKSEL
ncbi:MAG: hypothetical protein A2064_08870 [Spirochaetes bacterium GWB1_66_5]|nr:MAG: hypothetical protein A2064_08870 [Spirochaetes bacterium GWB1_66_5]